MLHNAKERSKKFHALSPVNPHKISREPNANAFETVKIVVTHGDALRFKVDVPKGCTISAALKQLGKNRVNNYRLIRQNNEVAANLTTLVEDGDLLHLA